MTKQFKQATPVLTLDVIKTPSNQPRAERQITSMDLYREIYVVPEGVEPMKEWIVFAYNPFKQDYERLFAYGPTEEEAIESVTDECYSLGWKIQSIKINHILHYYRDVNGDFKSILTREFFMAVGKQPINRIRSLDKYFSQKALTNVPNNAIVCA